MYGVLNLIFHEWNGKGSKDDNLEVFIEKKEFLDVISQSM